MARRARRNPLTRNQEIAIAGVVGVGLLGLAYYIGKKSSTSTAATSTTSSQALTPVKSVVLAPGVT